MRFELFSEANAPHRSKRASHKLHVLERKEACYPAMYEILQVSDSQGCKEPLHALFQYLLTL
jgi:hypothetical protein